jgi:hypothetical protein
MAVNVPNRETIHLRDQHSDLEQLWTEHRFRDTKLAMLADDTTAEALPGEVREISGAEVDLTVEQQGVWYQIFLPDIQVTVESAVLTREILQDAAGM